MVKKLVATLLASGMVILLAGCGAKQETSATESTTPSATEGAETSATAEQIETQEEAGNAEQGLKVAFVVQDMSNESMAYSYRMMEEYAADYGITMTAFDEANDPQKGVDAIGTCIAQKYDAMIVCPSDSAAVVPALMEAKEAGIIIGMFTADLPEEAQQYRDFYCGVNDTQAGEAAANALIEAFPNGCNVVEIGGQSGHDAQIKRGDGFKKGLEGSNINVLASQNCEAWSTEDAMAIMEDFITKYNDEIDAVFCHWDNGATGVINALDNAGIDDVFVIGIDGNSAGYDQVKSGKQSVSLGQSFSNMVIKSFENINAAKNGEGFEAVNWIPMDVVTSDNVEELPYPEW